MNILQILLVLAYLLWSYRVVFKLKWNRCNEDECYLWLAISIIVVVVLCVHGFHEGWFDKLNFLIQPLW